jgi:regulation of enolase protein 1 (concanavalin A-like superfamily)
VPPYLIVDDFESYTDTSPYRVFQTWIDGWGFSSDEFFPQGNLGNGTTSTVGYDPTVSRIMETTIATSGQSVPIDYNNINQPYYAEAERTWPTPQDWTAGGTTNLSLQVRGYPIGFVESSPGNITMSAGGADIVNLTDEFRYAYKRLSGDGSLTVRVESLVNTATWAKAGVIIRVGLQPVSAQVHMIATPANLVEFMYRRDSGLATTQIATAAGSTPLPYWVRLTRKGSTFTGEYSADGTSWNKITATDGTTSTMDVPMSGDVYIGLAVTATNASAVTTAVFSNVQVVGATGPWQVAEIGADHPGNDPATLYVALTDTANRTAGVL